VVVDLEKIAVKENLVLKAPDSCEALKWLVESLENKYEERVVVLIDEYDKTILDNIDKPELTMEIRKVFHDFYVGLKSVEDKLRFVFVAGISKFGKTAIHSALNNLNDITHDNEYAGICGYTEKEFIDNFFPLFDDLLPSLTASGYLSEDATQNKLIDTILVKYDGYSWYGETRVLNPYSINNCFSKRRLDNFWMETGPPFLLSHVMAQDPPPSFP
jgi:hypothetical protein